MIDKAVPEHSTLIAVAAITSISTTVVSIFTVWMAYKTKLIAHETHNLVNSELEKWKAAVMTVYRAEGAKQERVEERGRQEVIATKKEKAKL